MANLSDRATGLTNVNQINLNELSSTPSAPGAGQKKFYAKDDGKVYTLDNEGNEREVGSGSGASREIEQASHGFAVGDVLYFDGTTYAKAQADDEATAEVVGVVSSIVDTNKFVVTSSGYIEEGLSGLTAGSVYYLSASTAGLLTLTEPGVIGHVSKPMLLADSATSGYVLQYRGVLVGAVFGEDTPLNADNLTEGTINPARLPASLYRNRIINGDCRVAQRGAVPVVNNAITYGGADRTFCFAGSFASITGSIVKGVFSPSSSGFGQWAAGVTTTGTGLLVFGQRLEAADVADLNSKTVTFSAKVYQDTGSAQLLDVSLYQANALDNFAGVTSLGESSNISIPSGVATEVSLTLTLGSGDATNGLAFGVSFKNIGAVTNKNFAIADMQLVEGSVVSPFESRPYGHELSLCQRYYQIVCSSVYKSGQLVVNCYNTDDAYFRLPLIGQMRAVPITQTNSANFSVFAANGSVTDVIVGQFFSNLDSVGVRLAKPGGFVAGRVAHADLISGSITASAEL